LLLPSWGSAVFRRPYVAARRYHAAATPRAAAGDDAKGRDIVEGDVKTPTGATAHPRPGPLTREGSYAAAIYGSILTIGLIAALRHGATAQAIALTVISTNGVFWLAHVWSALLGARIETGALGGIARIRRLAAEEWTMVEAGMLPFLALAGAWAGLYSEAAGVHAALGFAIAQLVGWGLLGARRMKAGWVKSIVLGLVDGAFGVAIVWLETLIH
jgi:hypothetical protein